MLKKILFTLALISLLGFFSCKSNDDDPFAPESNISEQTKALLSGFGNGWNLGNTLDATSSGGKSNSGLSTEIGWGMPYTTKAMINAVAAEGFKTIRIPVSWHNHITEGTNYTIDSEWLERVKTIVDWSRAAGMKVIINIHHDNLSSSELSYNYGYTLNTDSSDIAKSKKYIERIWAQVADYFKNYDENLVFELLNEPRNRDESKDGFSGASNLSELNKIITEYEKAALDAIRASGGNNATRYVMVPPYAASPDLSDGWSLPSDSASEKLIVSIHAYTPFIFCGGAISTSTFTESHKNSINWLFNNLISNFTSKGIPVVIGEAGVSDKNNTDERKKWISYYYDKAKSANIPVVLWDNMVIYPWGNDAGERHGWFDRNSLSWFYPELISEILK